MLEGVLIERLVLEMQRSIILNPKDMPIKVPKDPRTLVEKLEPEKKKPKPEEKEKTKAQKEISDAVAEAAKEMNAISVPRQRQVVYDQKRAMYSLLNQEDSFLNYGKVAAPLDTEYNRSGYRYNEDSNNSASYNETITIKDVEKIIHENVFNAIFHTSTTSIKPEVKQQFEYWKLFNVALNRVKYDIQFM